MIKQFLTILNFHIVSIYPADNPINIMPPNFVELKVVECEPGIKGDTVTGGSKSATLETGTEIKVPLFVETGDTLKIDTRNGEYMSRV